MNELKCGLNNAYMNLYIFDANTNVTTDSGLSPEMKTYYEKRLIELADAKLVHDQFGDKYPIPKGSGKKIEFRKYDSLPKAMEALTEGVTPDGLKLNVKSEGAEVKQYGAWVSLSDILETSAIDNNVIQATKKLSSQAGRTLDAVSREVLNGGSSVRYAPKVNGNTVTEVSSRSDLDKSALLTPDVIFKAKADLAAVNAETIDDCYVAIIHPYVAYDLMRNEEWIDVHKYASPENIYKGEIGKLGGVRFVETSEAKIFAGEGIEFGEEKLNYLTLNGAIEAGPKTTFSFDGITVAEGALVGMYFDVGGVIVKITANTASAVTFASTVLPSVRDNTKIYATECASGAVFSTLVLGANAYGTTELEGGGLQHIVKPLGAGEDPLNQRASCGWKATKATKRLVEQYMIRIESCSSYSGTATSN